MTLAFLNQWMREMPFKLDTLLYLLRYVDRDTYQTVVDDKSGYDHLLLSVESRNFFVCSEVGGTLFTTPCLLAGRYLLCITTPLV